MTQKQQNIVGLQSALREAVTTLQLLQRNVCVLNRFANLKQEIIDCFNNGGKVLIAGNGGFAAISQHIAAELVGKLKLKRLPLPAISLASDISVLTCEANDFGFENVFSRQIEALAKTEDLVLCLTTSGKSKNILESISAANETGVKCYVVTGANPPKPLIELCQNIIALPILNSESIQDVAMILLHKICEEIESEFACKCECNIWNDIISLAKNGKYRWLVLDRDGVINELLPNRYALTIEDITLNSRFLESCKDIAQVYEEVFVVTNQACIGKGIVSSEQIDTINSYIETEIVKAGGRISGFYVCSDANSESVNRKPNTGLAEVIKQQFPEIDFSKTLVLGDSYSDELFARRIGASFIKIKNV